MHIIPLIGETPIPWAVLLLLLAKLLGLVLGKVRRVEVEFAAR